METAQPHQERAMTQEEARHRANLGRDKFYECVNSGRLRVRKLGRKCFVLESDLADFLRNLPVKPAKENATAA
jgi:hypothetical protein